MNGKCIGLRLFDFLIRTNQKQRTMCRLSGFSGVDGIMRASAVGMECREALVADDEKPRYTALRSHFTHAFAFNLWLVAVSEFTHPKRYLCVPPPLRPTDFISLSNCRYDSI